MGVFIGWEFNVLEEMVGIGDKQGLRCRLADLVSNRRRRLVPNRCRGVLQLCLQIGLFIPTDCQQHDLWS